MGEGAVEGSWVDRIVGLEDIHVDFAFMQSPDGHGRLELIKFHSPPAEGDGHAPANTMGIRHLAFAVEDIAAVVRGPEGIIVELSRPNFACSTSSAAKHELLTSSSRTRPIV